MATKSESEAVLIGLQTCHASLYNRLTATRPRPSVTLGEELASRTCSAMAAAMGLIGKDQAGVRELEELAKLALDINTYADHDEGCKRLAYAFTISECDCGYSAASERLLAIAERIAASLA